jgi:hypothetical protein
MGFLANTITKAKISVSFEYIDSEEIFGLVKKADYTLNVSDITFEEGNGSLLTGREAVKAAYARPNLVARIGGEEFVNGKIGGISFSESDLVGSEEVSLSITESVRIDDYSSHSVANKIPNPHLVSQFDETYDFSRSGNSINSKRDVSVTYSQDAGNQFLNNAKVFLQNIYFNSRPSYGFLSDGMSEQNRSNSGFVAKISENIDLIGLTVSLSEEWDSSDVDSQRDVSRKETEKIQLSQQGYLEKTISIEISSLKKGETDILAKAIKGIIDEKISQNQTQFGSPLSIEKGFIKNDRKASLTLSFSTDPRISQSNSVDYKVSKTKQGSFFEYTVESSFSSLGKHKKERINNAKAFWADWQSNIPLKVASLFPEAGSVFQKSKNVSFDKKNSSVSDTSIFSDDPAYDSQNLPAGILKYKTSFSKENQVKRNEVVFDLSSGQQKVSQNQLLTVGSAIVTANVVSSQSAGIFAGRDFLASQTASLDSLINEGDYYINSDEFTIDLGGGAASRVINYTFK